MPDGQHGAKSSCCNPGAPITSITTHAHISLIRGIMRPYGPTYKVHEENRRRDM